MPALETTTREQCAEIWLESSRNEFNERVYGSPKTVEVRWNWKRTLVNAAGEKPVAIDAEILVDAAYPTGSILRLLGSQIYTIIYDTMQSVDLKGRNTIYIARVQLYKGAIVTT